MPFGILDTQYIDLPANVDTTYLESLRTRSGYDFQRLLRELDSRLGALNRSLDPLLASLLAPATTDDVADTTMPSAFVITERGEYTIARPQFVEGAAHMLAMRAYDVTLGFTEDGLEDLSLPRILTNVDSLFLGMRRLYRKECLKRFFSDAEVRISIKTTATSPGFAGSGTGGNAFSGTYPDGTPLPGGYTHYYRDTQANLLAVIKSAKQRLRKWFPSGPFDLIAPQTQIDAIVALGAPYFYRSDPNLVRLGANSDVALLSPTEFVGVVDDDIRVHLPITDFADNNIGIFKTNGNLSPENTLVWKYDEKKGRQAYVRSRSMFPLADATVLQSFGINVSNRVAAALIRIDAAGGYVPPTFS
jgi:hypothetical protein